MKNSKENGVRVVTGLPAPTFHFCFNDFFEHLWGMPFRKDDAELRATVENVIECMKIDGTIAGLHEKWFGVAPASGSAALTAVSGYGQPGYQGYVNNGHEPSC